MTTREIYEAVLVEINKENAQSFSLEEFNYILNKSILSFVNNRYNFYSTNQQLSDDLRVLVKSQIFNVDDVDIGIDPTITVETFNPTTSYVSISGSTSSPITVSSVKDLSVGDRILFGENPIEFTISSGGIATNTITVSPTGEDVTKDSNIKVVTAPLQVNSDITTTRIVNAVFPSSDYLHLISCRTIWATKKPVDNTVTHIVFPAKRLTYDMLNAIENNTYLNPAPNRPYHQEFDNISNSGVTTFPATISEYKEYQNKPLIKVHIGKANSFMQLVRVEFDYLKIPEVVVLLDTDIFTADVDTSQVLEFPNGLLNEIVKRCTMYLLEKAGDPRSQTHAMVNQETSEVPLNMMIDNPAPKQRAETAQ